MKKILSLLFIVLLSFSLVSCSYVDELLDEENSITEKNSQVVDDENETIEENSPIVDKEETIDEKATIDEDGYYTSKEDVSLYIHTYGKLPNNFITKNEAKSLGWDSAKGNLWDVTDKKSIGGDRFGNREGSLPKKANRQYYECDIDYDGKYRGAKRIVYSNDGLIYYTEDHYDTFTLLYGDE